MATSSPRFASKILNTQTCAFVKRNFGLWASEFVRENTEVEDINIDITELAKILQALKFQIGGSSNDYAGSESGIKIEITCLKSKKHVVLISDNQCTCTKEETSAWEVMATSHSQQSLVEVGCSQFEPLQAEHALVVMSIIAYAVRLTKENFVKSTYKGLPGRRSDGKAQFSYDGTINSMKLLDVSTRFRSLDTLIKKEIDDVFPMPGALLKPGSTSVSKSDDGTMINLPEVQPNFLQGARRGNLLAFLTVAQENISNAVALVMKNSNVTDDKQKLKSPLYKPNVKSSATKRPKKKIDKYAHIQSTIPKPLKR